MQVTRRYWAAVGLASLLAVTALIFRQPLLVGGAGALGAWLLIQQIVFLKTVLQVDNQLSISQTVARKRVLAEDNVSIVLKATLPATDLPHPATLTITATLPPGLSHTDQSNRRLTLDADSLEETSTFTINVPVAGRFELQQPTVTMTDSQGLFKSTFPTRTADTPSITVVPRRPQNLHVGQGGDNAISAFGDHKTGDFGLGLEPGEVREYVPGDTIRQIDWKATARSTSPHVREFEEESDRQTVLFVDHRETMGTGIDGETKLDYARQVALAFADNAQSNQEPIGLYTVGDAGITTRQPAATTLEAYTQIQTTLHDLTLTHASADTHQTADSLPPRKARQAATTLTATDSPFATQLRPYFEASRTYVQRISSQPLYKTVKTQLARQDNTISAIVLTDDKHRSEVRETVKLARKQHGDVLVFLTPTVLFEREGLTDINHAYDRYSDFEEFRRDLTRLEGVSAFEIGPGDRLDALLATQSTPKPTHQ
ncbi:DUF58 domain-containing protein [Halorussus salinisoli]|uniref:DUF58 domain-containing protein n=1 Tax=Halorussus salinisoli TaxID=2558242 RepID=UPI0010C1C177|nr:DUF58 domain-containing protein [Halorussus salinisoli]